jgi:hypothetical protein
VDLGDYMQFDEYIADEYFPDEIYRVPEDKRFYTRDGCFDIDLIEYKVSLKNLKCGMKGVSRMLCLEVIS